MREKKMMHFPDVYNRLCEKKKKKKKSRPEEQNVTKIYFRGLTSFFSVKECGVRRGNYVKGQRRLSF